jgi:hypothetical protein
LYAKAFSAESAFVGHVLHTATATSMKVSWEAPEYSDELTGYQVSLWFKEVGNGDDENPVWDADELVLYGRQTLSPGVRSALFGCSDGLATIDCLSPYTHYFVEIAVLRGNVLESPLTFYTETLKRVRDQVEMFAHSGDIFVVFLSDKAMLYGPNTPIEDTIFINASMVTTNGDFYLSLRNSTVQSLSPSTFHLRMSDEDFKYFIDAVVYSGSIYSERVLIFGRNVQTTLPVVGYSLSISPTRHLSFTICSSDQL